MSVTDPCITEIKGWTAKLLINNQTNGCISDTDENLIPFCQSIETIFDKGLSPQYNSLGFTKDPDAWHWLERLSNEKHDCISFAFTHALGSVKRNPTTAAPKGVLRLFIRTCLVNKCLHVPIEYLIQSGKSNQFYSRHYSIIGDDILVQIFLSVLLQCSKFYFKLDLTNSSFLNYSWTLPKILTMELVPCKALGLSVSFVKGKAMIVNMKSNSVASDEDVIEIGDVLDNLNGVHICAATKGNLKTIMNKQSGRPVTVRIIKAKLANGSTDFYEPIVPLLKLAKIDPDALKLKNEEQNECNQRSDSEHYDIKQKSTGYTVIYLGKVETGGHGDTKQIEKAVRALLSPMNCTEQNKELKCERIKQAVCIELGEIGLKIVQPEDNTIILNHSFMEISSCGSITNLPHYFAYIAGEKSCNIAKKFTCYIFHSKNENDVVHILQSIGQGFHRTNFAV